MKSITKIILIISVFFVALFIFLACETDITVDLPKPEEKLNVMGSIDISEYPMVFLTKNSAYFDIVDSTYVKDLIIYGNKAIVIVSCENLIDTLNPHIFPIWPYYGYKGTKFVGEIGKKYRLDIKYNEKQYYSTTTIRDTVGIDSVKYIQIIDKDSTKAGYLTMYWRNPVGNGNYFTVRLKSPNQKWFFRPMMVNVLDDKLVGNENFLSCPFLTRSYERNSYYAASDDKDTTSFMQQILFNPLDTVSIKLSTIDDEAYLFWSSWERNKLTDGNPFVNPASVKSNIKGESANGSWVGYGSFIKTFRIDSTKKVVPINNF